MSDDFKVRFLKLNIKIRFIESGELPQYKVSAIRGGIGEMLLRQNCIYERDCETCSFKDECLVQRIYYHPLKIVPKFVKDKSNMGYLYECRDFRTNIQKSDILRFSMLLLGDVIVHAPHILNAIQKFGEIGFGRNKIKFILDKVENNRRETVFDKNVIYNRRFSPLSLNDYINTRLSKNPAKKIQVCFMTPWTQKYKGKFLQQFDGDAFVESVYRRVYLANCMEGNEINAYYNMSTNIIVSNQEVKHREISRFSSTHNCKIELKGLIGKFTLSNVPKEFMPYIYAGELLHIGKNTSMGFGQYKVI